MNKNENHCFKRKPEYRRHYCIFTGVPFHNPFDGQRCSWLPGQTVMYHYSGKAALLALFMAPETDCKPSYGIPYKVNAVPGVRDRRDL